jgi:uncharacterized protein (DUF433 family)
MSSIWTHHFTPNEAAALTDVSEKQVRKDIEYRVIPAETPPRLPFASLVYLRALKLLEVQLVPHDRARLAQRLFDAMQQSDTIDMVEMGEVFAVRIGRIIKRLETKTHGFTQWKLSLVVDPNIMGGEPVFPKSRLTVRHVGGMLERGEAPEVIIEDYPYLTADDLEYARVYWNAYPRVGRPPASSPSH